MSASRHVKHAVRRLIDHLSGRTLPRTLARQQEHWQLGATLVLSFDVETAGDCLALPALCTRLMHRSLPASFACIGALAERFPEEHRRLIEGGFEVINHSDSHPWHTELGNATHLDQLADEEVVRDLMAASDRLARLGGHPTGFRTPHFGVQHTPRLYPLLGRAGITHSTSTVASRTRFGGAPFEIAGIWEFPVLQCPRHPDVPLDSWHCTGAPDAAHAAQGEVLDVHAEAISLVERFGAFGSVYWDPAHCDDRYDQVLDLLRDHTGRLRTTTYGRVLQEVSNRADGLSAVAEPSSAMRSTPPQRRSRRNTEGADRALTDT